MTELNVIIVAVLLISIYSKMLVSALASQREPPGSNPVCVWSLHVLIGL